MTLTVVKWGQLTLAINLVHLLCGRGVIYALKPTSYLITEFEKRRGRVQKAVSNAFCSMYITKNFFVLTPLNI